MMLDIVHITTHRYLSGQHVMMLDIVHITNNRYLSGQHVMMLDIAHITTQIWWNLMQVTPPRQTPPFWADTPRQTPHPLADTPPPGRYPPRQTHPLPPTHETATAADGTHPNGMYSCFLIYILNLGS